MKKDFIRIPAPILLKFSIHGIDVYVQDEDGIVVNFFRRDAVRDDDGFLCGKHIGHMKTKDINDIYKRFKEKYPEELL